MPRAAVVWYIDTDVAELHLHSSGRCAAAYYIVSYIQLIKPTGNCIAFLGSWKLWAVLCHSRVFSPYTTRTLKHLFCDVMQTFRFVILRQ